MIFSHDVRFNAGAYFHYRKVKFYVGEHSSSEGKEYIKPSGGLLKLLSHGCRLNTSYDWLRHSIYMLNLHIHLSFLIFSFSNQQFILLE